MIYMRQKGGNKKKEDSDGRVQRSSNRNTIENLKSKLMKKNTNISEGQTQPKDDKRISDDKGLIKLVQIQNQKPIRFVISKSKGQSQPLNDKYSQSIIIHNVSHQAGQSKRSNLNINHCFDVQIKNQLGSSRYKVQTYIQLLEKQREEKSKEISMLKDSKQMEASQRIENSKEQLFQSRSKAYKLQRENQQKGLLIAKYLKYFQEEKKLLIQIAMGMIEFKKENGKMLNREQIMEREKKNNYLIERIEKNISIYTNFLQFSLRKRKDEIISIDQLWNTVKYQQKIIQLLKQNPSNSHLIQLHHQNTLLRYQINRLSQHNEQLLKLLDHSTSTLKLQYSNSHKVDNIIIQQNEQSFDSHLQSDSPSDQTQSIHQQTITSHNQSLQSEDNTTPFRQLKDQSPSIHQPFSNIEMDHLIETNKKLDHQLADTSRKIQNLLIEKQYILDELEKMQSGNTDLQKQLKNLLQENELLKQSVRELKVPIYQYKNNEELNKYTSKVLEEQNQLLRNKIKIIFRTNGKNTATVEELLKLLNQEELSNYHQALIELISRYQQRISQLTSSFLYEKQLKDHSLNFCKGLFNLIQSKKSHSEISLEEIVRHVEKYEQIMKQLRENEIDIYLRKIKCFSIGIEAKAIEAIKDELKCYVDQLQTRLPAVTEEYLEDGSSVSSSMHVSTEQFQ